MNSLNAAPVPASIDALVQALQSVGYFADRRLATAVFLALKLQRPLLLEASLAWARRRWPRPSRKCCRAA